jgi:hypothetical protein
MLQKPSDVSAPDRPADVDLLAMWSALLASEWDSLAVIPADPDVALGPLVDALVASSHGARRPATLVDARGVDALEGKRLASEIPTGVGAGERPVVVMDSLMRSLTGVHFLPCVRSVLLVVQVGATDPESLSSTVSLVGVERIIGSVAAPARS